MIHDEARRLLVAGSVMEDLEPAERREYEAHRAGCGICRDLEAELDGVLMDLALSVPERMPPPDVLAAIRRAIHADAASSLQAPVAIPLARTGPAAGAAEGPAARPTGARGTITSLDAARASRRPLFAAVGLAAALALVAVGLGSRTVSLSEQLDRSTAQLVALRADIATQGSVMAVAVDPRHVTTALHAEPLAPAASAVVLYVPGTSDAYLVAHNLPATPAGHEYQLWYADTTGVHALGTATWNGSGTFVAPFDVDLARSAAVMVTLEPAGGATGQPGPQVVFGELGTGI